jgi:hypothetical protein
MTNLLLDQVDYKIEETPRGTWKRYVYPSGGRYAEFTSRTTIFGLAFLHYTVGICPETGKRKTAKGFIALGRKAMGVIAIGQFAAGLVTFAQFGIGLLLGLGQFIAAPVAIGQLALALYFGLGQLATGDTAIGQLAYGRMVLAQMGMGEHVWSMRRADPEAVEFFRSLLSKVLPG